MRCYLAGPIKNLSYEEATDWRDEATGFLAGYGIQGVSPMRFKAHLRYEEAIAGSYEGSTMSSQKGLTARDHNDVYTCDLVLANFLGAEIPSLGTALEFGWASAYRKPVVMVAEEDNVHQHPMLREVAGFIVPTLQQALSVVIAVLDARPNGALPAKHIRSRPYHALVSE